MYILFIWTNVISILSFYLSLPLLTYSYFLMLNAHSLSRSRHFHYPPVRCLTQGGRRMRILDNSHPFFRSHTPSPLVWPFWLQITDPYLTYLTYLERESPHYSTLACLILTEWRSSRHWDVILFSHWIPLDLMTTCRFPCRKKHTSSSLSSIAKCFIYTLPCLSSILLLLCMGEGGGTRLGMSSFLWRQSQFNSGQTKCLILEGGSLFA